MLFVNRLSSLALCVAVTWFSGCCVGPLGCGPKACGPIALGDPCGGCGQCDGCGELYLDPWINHPPNCCDPCDSCGNYNGQSCGKCRSVFAGVKTIWGYRCNDGCGGCDRCGEVACGCEAGPSCQGCDACTGHDATCGFEHEVACGVDYDVTCGTESYVGSGIPIVDDRVVRIITEPSPAREVTAARPALRPYPQGTRRIFKARSDVANGAAISGDF